MSPDPRVKTARDVLVDRVLARLGGSTLLAEDDPGFVAASITAADVEALRVDLHLVSDLLLGHLFDNTEDEVEPMGDPLPFGATL